MPEDERPGAADDPQALEERVTETARALMEFPGAAATLLSADGEDAERRAAVFGLLLEQARMDAENGGHLGDSFLAEAREAVLELNRAGGIDLEKGTELLRAYVEAGLEAPGELMLFLLENAAVRIREEGLPENFDAEMEELRRRTEGDDYRLYIALREIMDAVPVRLQPLVMQEMMGEDERWSGRALLYWLLEESGEARMMAAESLAERARQGTLDAAATSALRLIRTWLPADDVAPVVDEALREARRRGVAGAPGRPALRVARLVGSLPDGSGGQCFVAGLEGADGPAAMIVLLKTGFGVRDAFPVRGEEAAGVPSLQLGEAGTFELEPGALEPALAAALADGLAAGVPPPPGLLDVFEACGLEALRPRPTTARDWLGRLDPARAVTGPAADGREELLEGTCDRLREHGFEGYWYESPEFVEEALEGIGDFPQAEPALWTALEERRGHWALVLARSAHVLKLAAGDLDWRPFAATAAALIEGEPLRDIPVMHVVLTNSIAVWQDEDPALDKDGLPLYA